MENTLKMMQSLPVKELRPTQIAVGRALVRQKRQGLRAFARQPQELVDYIVSRPIRVVLGPRHRVYIIDHHHLGMALLKEGFKTAPLLVEADLSAHPMEEFWRMMQEHRWVYPFDGRGKQRKVTDIPGALEDMEDDPYRSLAGMVRAAGGFEKTETPYVEFSWANYFRPLIKRSQLKGNFEKALHKATMLAKAPGAKDLPGYKGKAKS